MKICCISHLNICVFGTVTIFILHHIQCTSLLDLHRNRDRELPDCVADRVHDQVFDCVELCEDVDQHDQQLTDRLLPVIKQRVDNATQALTDCLEIKDIAEHWYTCV